MSERYYNQSIGQLYDQQATVYKEFCTNRFSWEHVERPAFDTFASDLFLPTTRVLDIGTGTGIVPSYLITKGIPPQNIIGIDISNGLLQQARIAVPSANFINASATEFILPPASIDLVTSNTVLHHLDPLQVKKMGARIYDALSPGGTYFFVEVNSDHTKESRKHRNEWITVKTPWGTEVPFFNHSIFDVIDILAGQGLDMVDVWLIGSDPEGKEIDAENYFKYTFRQSRLAGRFKKVPEFTRLARMHGARLPLGIENHDQEMQHDLVEQYFDAWIKQSIETITQIFAEDATYDEKPGVEIPLKGIEQIKKYWDENPVSQRNIQMAHEVVGFSDGNAIWSTFKGGFDTLRKHIEIEGVIKFTVDAARKKITALEEYFRTQKTQF